MNKVVHKFYAGIDVSKESLDVAISNDKNIVRYENNEQGLQKLLKQLPDKKDCLIVMEASGGYERLSSNWLRRKGFKVAVVNARRVRLFASAAGQLAKTDKIDAKIIMEYGRTFNPIAQEAPTELQENLVANRKRREQLIKMLTMEKQHLLQSNSQTKKRIKTHIKALEKELKLVDKDLEKLINNDAVMQEKIERLDAIGGVGKVTAMNIVTALPELGQLTPKEAAALTGLAPYNNDSGKKKGKREIDGGRASVRTALYMAVLTAKQYNPVFKKFYDRLIAKGKAKKVAITACMRKLIIVMNAMIRDGSEWQPQLRIA